MTRYSLQVILILSVFAFAWAKGGKPERYVSSIYLGVLTAGVMDWAITGEWSNQGYNSLQIRLFLTDLSALSMVVFVALKFDRWWTLWVGSAQFLTVTAHLLKAFHMPIRPEVYVVMERWPVWLAILLTAWGTCHFVHRAKDRESCI